MPLIDMPLEKLKQYQGINPCPEDLDAFWDKSIAEMEQVDPQVELIPASFRVKHADCYDMWFTGVGGARVYAKLLKPKSLTKPAPAVLLFHGYSGSSGDWHDKLAYVNEGFVVAALDCRGQGGKSQDSGQSLGNTLHGHIIRGLDDCPEKLLFRSIFLDTAQLARIVMSMEDVDETRVGAMGGSQGGGLTLACAALTPNLNRAAPMYPFLSDYRRVWEMDMAERAYVELKEFFRHTDPQHKMEDEYFRRLGYIDVHNLAHRIKARVLMATGLMDNVCPASTQFAAYNRMNCPKEVRIYPDFGHEGLPGFWDEAMMYMLEMTER